MPKCAILSDVHGNLDALQAVLKDIRQMDCKDIVCLGDLIGYGPQPREVLRKAMRTFRFCLLGNHEEAIIFEPIGFNWKAEISAYWTREQLTSRHHPGPENRKFWDYLLNLRRYWEDRDILYVHASPFEPTKEYVMPEAAQDRRWMKAIFERIPRIAFAGHTHIPGVFAPGRPFLSQQVIEEPVRVDKGKFLINVGSVGQPRDGDPRACYVIHTGRRVIFRRVEYDFRRTQRKIRRIRNLPNALGHRLGIGL